MSLLNTRVQDLRLQSPDLSKWTNRPSRYGALNVFLAGNDEANSIISPELLDRAASAVGRQVQVPVFDSETVTIGNTRSVTIADSENNSQLYTVSFTTYSWGFTLVPSMYMNNEVSMQADFNRKFMKYLFAFAATQDSACLAALDANKSKVYANRLNYGLQSDTLVAGAAYDEKIFGDLTAIANANDFYGGYHLVGDPGVQSRVMRIAQHGMYNDQDKTLQFLDKQVHFTNRIALPTLTNPLAAAGYLVNAGSVGQLYRHEAEALLGTVLPDGTEWQIDTLPMLNMPIDTYFYYGRSDASALAGAASAHLTRVAKEHYGFAIEVANVVAYNDNLTAKASPIMKFAIEL